MKDIRFPYFSMKELCTDFELNNVVYEPDEKIEQQLIQLIDKVLIPLRRLYGWTIIVKKAFNPNQHDHKDGVEVDICTIDNTANENMKLVRLLQKTKSIPFDKLFVIQNGKELHLRYDCYKTAHSREISYVKTRPVSYLY